MARVMREYILKETGAKMVVVVVSNNEELAEFEPNKVLNENVCVYIVDDDSISSAEKEKIRNNCINFEYNYMGVYKEEVPEEKATTSETTKTSEKGEVAEKKEE